MYFISLKHILKSALLKRVCIISILFLFSLSSCAQDTTKNKWNSLVEPYLMFPNLKGSVGLGTLPDVELDADPGDVFSKLKMAAILYFEMNKDKWAFTSDIIYMNLEQDASSGKLVNSGSVELKQFSWELAGLRKLQPWLEAGIGGRINNLETSVDLVTNTVGGGTTARNKSIKQTWFDAIIIARVKSAPEKKFIYQFRGDLGGFGIGSDFAWQLQAYAGYRFSKVFQATAGYKIISVDYNSGSGDSRFLYNVDTFGTVARLGFNF